MTSDPMVGKGSPSDPFGQFRAECESLLRDAYSNLQKSDRKRFPELDLASSLEDPPNQEFGHLASSLSFELSRVQKTKPMTIAKEIVHEFGKAKVHHLAESVQAAESGYVNFKAKIETLTQLTLDAILHEGSSYGLLKTGQPQGVIVEHTSANPARPIHIGTAKNSIFGDTLARLLSARGHIVQTHFYIDDTGRQCAIMAYGYKLLNEPIPKEKPDHFIGKIYSVTATLVEIEELKKRLALLKKNNASDADIVATTKSLDEWVGTAADLQSKYPAEFDQLSKLISKDSDPENSISELIRKYEKKDPETTVRMRRVTRIVLSGFEQTLQRACLHFVPWDWEGDLL